MTREQRQLWRQWFRLMKKKGKGWIVAQVVEARDKKCLVELCELLEYCNGWGIYEGNFQWYVDSSPSFAFRMREYADAFEIVVAKYGDGAPQ